MPDTKLVVSVVAGVAALVFIALSLTWLIVHPLVIIAIVGSIVLLVRYGARRNRV